MNWYKADTLAQMDWTYPGLVDTLATSIEELQMGKFHLPILPSFGNRS